MPLTEKVTFKTLLQKGNKLQVPELIRLQFKIETNQVLNVGVNDLNVQSGWQFFFAKMGKDGRVRVPKLILTLLGEENSDLTGHILEVTLEPFQATQ
jgi:hypothetical protein